MIILRSIFKELYSSLLAITLVLLIIFITNQFLHYLNDAARGWITMTAVVKIMSLQVPLLLGYLLPLGLYLGILLTFGRLYIDHEMTVLSACGVSKAKLLGIVMLFAVIVMIVVAWLMLWVEPKMEQYQMTVIQNALTSASMQKVVPKRFQALPNGGVFYANKIHRAKSEMQNIFLAYKDKSAKKGVKGPWDITVAKSAQEKTLAESKDQFLIFSNGSRYIGVPGQHDFKIIKYDKYGVKLTTKPANRTADWPMNLPTMQLWHLAKTNLKAAAILQWRFAMPISVLIFALLAVPLSRIKPRQGRFAHLIHAILIYLGYADLLFLGRAWIENGTVSPSLGFWWIHACALLLGLLLLMHFIGWKRALGLQRNTYEAN